MSRTDVEYKVEFCKAINLENVLNDHTQYGWIPQAVTMIREAPSLDATRADLLVALWRFVENQERSERFAGESR